MSVAYFCINFNRFAPNYQITSKSVKPTKFILITKPGQTILAGKRVYPKSKTYNDLLIEIYQILVAAFLFCISIC